MLNSAKADVRGQKQKLEEAHSKRASTVFNFSVLGVL
jgi:hypothetical protein